MILTNKKSLRPKLQIQKGSTDTEQFQNSILRPILKLQNNIISGLFNINLQKQKITLKSNASDKLIQIKEICQKDNSMKNQFIGAVIGMLEQQEFDSYSKNKNELNRRIIQMIIQRIFDQL